VAHLKIKNFKLLRILRWMGFILAGMISVVLLVPITSGQVKGVDQSRIFAVNQGFISPGDRIPEPFELNFISAQSFQLDNFRDSFGPLNLNSQTFQTNLIFSKDAFVHKQFMRKSKLAFIGSNNPSFSFDLRNSYPVKISFKSGSVSSHKTLSAECNCTLTINSPYSFSITSNTILDLFQSSNLGENILFSNWGFTPVNSVVSSKSYISKIENFLQLILNLSIQGFFLTLFLIVTFLFLFLFGFTLAKFWKLNFHLSFWSKGFFGFIIFFGTNGALNYFLPGKYSVVVVLGISFILISIQIIKHGIKDVVESLQNDVRGSRSSLLPSFLFASVALFYSAVHRFSNIGLSQTDVNGYVFVSKYSSDYAFLNVDKTKTITDITGNGARTFDHSYRGAFAILENWNLIIVLTSLLLVVFLLGILIDFFKDYRSAKISVVFGFLIIASGSYAGLWMEGYLTRWMWAILATINVIFCMRYLQDSTKEGYAFTVVLTSFVLISLVPTFIVIPFLSTFFVLFSLHGKRKNRANFKKRNRYTRIGLTSSIILIGFCNMIWLRGILVASNFASNGILDDIARWIVVPFYKSSFFLFTGLGLAPWHSNSSSIFGESTNVLTLDLVNFLRPLHNTFLAQSWLGVTLCLIIALFFLLKITSNSFSSDSRNRLVYSYLVTVLGISSAQIVSQSLIFPSRLYVNSMTFLSYGPYLFAVLILLLSWKNPTVVQKNLDIKSKPKSKIQGRVISIFMISLLSASTTTTIIEYSRWGSSSKGLSKFSYLVSQAQIQSDIERGVISKKSIMSGYFCSKTTSDYFKQIELNLVYRNRGLSSDLPWIFQENNVSLPTNLFTKC
jgi:hypothetical protein